VFFLWALSAFLDRHFLLCCWNYNTQNTVFFSALCFASKLMDGLASFKSEVDFRTGGSVAPLTLTSHLMTLKMLGPYVP
jgi:hypothetical protein